MTGNAILLPLLLLAGFTASCDDIEFDMGGERVEAPFHNTFNVKPGGRLDVESFNGSIEIRGWSENRVDVDGVKYGHTAAARDAIRIEMNPSADGVSLRAVRPTEHHSGTGARFVIRVPNNYELSRVVTSNGSIRIQDVSGAVRARTSNGSMTLAHLNGALNASTSNSSINVSELTGNAVLETSNGHIGADHVNGQVDATTSNGSIEINFETSPKNNMHASTSNSSITIHMPSSSAAKIRASTSNGSIDTDFQLSSQGSVSKNHLEGAVNGGGPLLDLNTSNGSIKVLKP